MKNTNEDYSAIIDIGSNSMRLVIYQKEITGRLYEVENVKAVARLSNYLDHEHNLSPEGIDVLLNTLAHFLTYWQSILTDNSYAWRLQQLDKLIIVMS